MGCSLQPNTVLAKSVQVAENHLSKRLKLRTETCKYNKGAELKSVGT